MATVLPPMASNRATDSSKRCAASVSPKKSRRFGMPKRHADVVLSSGFGRHRGEFRTADQDEANGEVTDGDDRCLAEADLLAVHKTEEGQRRPRQREAGRF